MNATCSDGNDDPLEVLKVQLQEFAELVVDGNDGGGKVFMRSLTRFIFCQGKPFTSVIEIHTETSFLGLSDLISIYLYILFICGI